MYKLSLFKIWHPGGLFQHPVFQPSPPSLSPNCQESDLVYQVKDLELIEQHDQLEAEIRRRLAQEDSEKTDLQRLEEEAMINELVELVEKRDRLLWALHVEKTL